MDSLLTTKDSIFEGEAIDLRISRYLLEITESLPSEPKSFKSIGDIWDP